MQRFEVHRVDSTAQIASAGLTIRQKEPKIWRLPSIGSTPILLRPSCSTYAAIFLYQPSIATFIAWASMVLSGIRFP